MKLLFNAVGQLQMVIVCPSCGKAGKDTKFTDCCFRFALMRLGIQDRRKCPLCDEGFVTDDDEIGCRPGYCSTNAVPVGEMLRDAEGFCYAYEDCNEEHCKGYKPHPRMFTNGGNSECQHHSLDGHCTL
jgi:hypothetical protein